jgi:hypothetical protein
MSEQILRYRKASKEAWQHARETTGLSNAEIARMAGWVLENGKNIGKPTQNVWCVARGDVIPTIPSLLQIQEFSAVGHQFVMAYLEGLTWLARD